MVNDYNHSVLTYLNAYDEALRMIREAPDDIANRMTFERFDPTLVGKFTAVKARAKLFAEKPPQAPGGPISPRSPAI